MGRQETLYQALNYVRSYHLLEAVQDQELVASLPQGAPLAWEGPVLEGPLALGGQEDPVLGGQGASLDPLNSCLPSACSTDWGDPEDLPQVQKV